MGDMLPAPLVENTPYNAVNVTADTFQVAEAGLTIALTSVGVEMGGSHSVQRSFTWPTGDTDPKQIAIPLNDDLLIEGTERFTLTLEVMQLQGEVSVLGQTTIEVNILDNDLPGGVRDDSFVGGVSVWPGPNTNVNDIVTLADGKAVVVGRFTGYDSIPRNRVARVNADGTLDATFLPVSGANGAINAIALDQNTEPLNAGNVGKLLVVGQFTDYDGMPRNRIARIHGTGALAGTLDTTFNIGTGADNAVHAVAVQPDGKIVMAGSFTSVDGVPRNFIARLNADGTIDNGFMNGLIGPDSTVQALAIDTSGGPTAPVKIVIAGDFSTVNGKARSRVARLNPDGTVDDNFLRADLFPNGGANDLVFDVAIDQAGNILIGGRFTMVNGTPRAGIARFNP